MKPHIRLFTSLCICISALTASAQYYEIANQLPQLIRPALSGSFNYKGFVDVSYMRGVSKCKADFLDVTTSQGFRYADWFYMGVGIGADVLFSSTDDNWGSGWNDGSSPDLSHSSTTTAVMLPLFTDFRFTFGGVNTLAEGVTRSSVGFFIDLRIGCSFLCSDDWIRINNGYLTNQQYFYLRPSVGLRIPVGTSGRQAFDIGLCYKLLTSNYWGSSKESATLSSLGLTVAFEW